MKRPFEAVAGMLRATGADFFPTDPFLNNFQATGERLFQWRTPDGYPDARARWAGTASMLGRWRLANQMLSGGMPGVKIVVDLPPSSASRPPELVDAWSKRILGRPMTAEDASAITDFLSRPGIAGTRGRLPASIALILMSPDFQVC
jgi:hypothetical protein